MINSFDCRAIMVPSHKSRQKLINSRGVCRGVRMICSKEWRAGNILNFELIVRDELNSVFSNP